MSDPANRKTGAGPNAPKPRPRAQVAALLQWFAATARDLPWRRTHDPYAIWVSEIMLQQTQVKTVVPYWERWMRRLPTIESLATARLQTIYKLWEGLGYYTRVRNLQKAAQIILKSHDGVFPDAFQSILALPGIGRYTAGAIASIAFNQPAAILDGNVVRVLTRLYGIAEDPREKHTNNRLWDLAGVLVREAHSLERVSRQKGKAGRASATKQGPTQFACSQLNQSLMELGALVCTPRSPACDVCPVARYCVARRENRVAELPRPKDRSTPEERHFAAYVIEHEERFLVWQREAGTVNAHLWEFPNWEIQGRGSAASVAKAKLPTIAGRWSKLCSIRHSITRYRITTEAYHIRLENPPLNLLESDGIWRSRAQLRKLPFTSAHRKIAGSL